MAIQTLPIQTSYSDPTQTSLHKLNHLVEPIMTMLNGENDHKDITDWVKFRYQHKDMPQEIGIFLKYNGFWAHALSKIAHLWHRHFFKLFSFIAEEMKKKGYAKEYQDQLKSMHDELYAIHQAWKSLLKVQPKMISLEQCLEMNFFSMMQLFLKMQGHSHHEIWPPHSKSMHHTNLKDVLQWMCLLNLDEHLVHAINGYHLKSYQGKVWIFPKTIPEDLIPTEDTLFPKIFRGTHFRHRFFLMRSDHLEYIDCMQKLSHDENVERLLKAHSLWTQFYEKSYYEKSKLWSRIFHRTSLKCVALWLTHLDQQWEILSNHFMNLWHAFESQRIEDRSWSLDDVKKACALWNLGKHFHPNGRRYVDSMLKKRIWLDWLHHIQNPMNDQMACYESLNQCKSEFSSILDQDMYQVMEDYHRMVMDASYEKDQVATMIKTLQVLEKKNKWPHQVVSQKVQEGLKINQERYAPLKKSLITQSMKTLNNEGTLFSALKQCRLGKCTSWSVHQMFMNQTSLDIKSLSLLTFLRRDHLYSLLDHWVQKDLSQSQKMVNHVRCQLPISYSYYEKKLQQQWFEQLKKTISNGEKIPDHLKLWHQTFGASIQSFEPFYHWLYTQKDQAKKEWNPLIQGWFDVSGLKSDAAEIRLMGIEQWFHNEKMRQQYGFDLLLHDPSHVGKWLGTSPAEKKKVTDLLCDLLRSGICTDTDLAQCFLQWVESPETEALYVDAHLRRKIFALKGSLEAMKNLKRSSLIFYQEHDWCGLSRHIRKCCEDLTILGSLDHDEMVKNIEQVFLNQCLKDLTTWMKNHASDMEFLDHMHHWFHEVWTVCQTAYPDILSQVAPVMDLIMTHKADWMSQVFIWMCEGQHQSASMPEYDVLMLLHLSLYEPNHHACIMESMRNLIALHPGDQRTKAWVTCLNVMQGKRLCWPLPASYALITSSIKHEEMSIDPHQTMYDFVDDFERKYQLFLNGGNVSKDELFVGCDVMSNVVKHLKRLDYRVRALAMIETIQAAESTHIIDMIPQEIKHEDQNNPLSAWGMQSRPK